MWGHEGESDVIPILENSLQEHVLTVCVIKSNFYRPSVCEQNLLSEL